MGRDHQHLHVEPPAFDLADELQPFMPGICRSVTITSTGLPAKRLERFGGAGARGDVVAGCAQHVGHGFARRGMVVDHQHAESVRLCFGFRLMRRLASCGVES